MWPFGKAQESSKKDELVALPEQVDERAPEPKEEWVWVDGVKGMHADMTGRTDFQFEVGKSYKIDDPENIKVCEYGFHFNLNLKDVFVYYRFDFQNRYFRVSGLVKKSDLEKYSGRSVCPYPNYVHDKLVAKEITILEEVDSAVLYEEIKGIFPALESVEEMQSIHSLDQYSIVEREKAFAKLKNKFSKAFFMIITEGMNHYTIRILADYMESLIDQGVSSDMAAYMAVKYADSKRQDANAMIESYLQLLSKMSK